MPGTRTGTSTHAIGHDVAAAQHLAVPHQDNQWPPLPDQQTVCFALPRGDPSTRLVGKHGYGAVSGTISAEAAKEAVMEADKRWRRLKFSITMQGRTFSPTGLMDAANRKRTTSIKQLEVYERHSREWVSLFVLARRYRQLGSAVVTPKPPFIQRLAAVAVPQEQAASAMQIRQRCCNVGKQRVQQVHTQQQQDEA